jgi:peptide/nickel transport system substrate-binding protein
VYALSYLGDISSGAILPREIISAGTSLYTSAVGSGPFRLDSSEPPNAARLLRHDGYYRAPIPYLDGMRWQVYADEDSLVAAMRAGDLDVISGSREALRNLGEEIEDVVVEEQPGLSSIAIGFRTDGPLLKDPRVRKAIDVAIDRDALINSLAPGARVVGPVNANLADGFWSLPEDAVRAQWGAGAIEERRTNAMLLLDASGTAGATFELQVANVAPLVETARAVRDQLATIGLTVKVQPLDLLPWFTNSRRGAFEATLINQLPYESPDIPTRCYHSAGPDATGSPFAFADSAIDALVERAWGENDRERRRTTLLDAQQLMVQARPLVTLFAASGSLAARTYVQNWRPTLPGTLSQYNYEQWIEGNVD